jgi:hypothetical protein
MLSASADKEEIFRKVKSSFSDYALFDRLVATKLREAIRDTDTIEINTKTTEKVAERYFDAKSFKTPEQRLALTQIELIFKTSYILILSHKDENRALLWHDMKTLFNTYPEFVNADPHEQQLLLRYRNACRIALTVIPARRNKALIMKIAERLEGSQKDYITGGGQSTEVKRRVQIYEKEGNIQAEKRPPRERKCKDRGVDKTSHIATFSVKRAKLVRLQTEDSGPLAKDAPDGYVDSTSDSKDPSLSSQTTKVPTPAPAAALAPLAPKPAKPVKTQPAETMWSPLNALSAVACSMPLAPEIQPASVIAPAPALASLMPTVVTADYPLAAFPVMRASSQDWSSRESSYNSGFHPAVNSLLPHLPAPPGVDNMSYILAASDPEFWKEAQNSAVSMGRPAPMLRQNSLSLDGKPLGENSLSFDVNAFSSLGSEPSFTLPLRKNGRAKNGHNAHKPAPASYFESSLGLYSNLLPTDVHMGLQRTSSAGTAATIAAGYGGLSSAGSAGYFPYSYMQPQLTSQVDLLYATATGAAHGFPGSYAGAHTGPNATAAPKVPRAKKVAKKA